MGTTALAITEVLDLAFEAHEKVALTLRNGKVVKAYVTPCNYRNVQGVGYAYQGDYTRLTVHVGTRGRWYYLELSAVASADLV